MTRAHHGPTTGSFFVPGVSAASVALAAACSAVLPAPLAAQAQRPPCADALLVDAPVVWETAELIAADLTLDGVVEAAYWRVEDSQVVVLMGSCDGDEVTERRRFEFELAAGCAPDEARVEAASLLLDEALVARTCAGERSASECAHLRRENERRRALMDAGGRALRIVGGPSCTPVTLRWAPEAGGFLRIPG